MKMKNLIKEEKFTFKLNRATGRYRSFETETVDIKLKRGIVGNVYDKSPYKIHLMIKKDTELPPDRAPFKWITLKREFESLDECKKWLVDNTNRIIQQFDLYQMFD